MASRTVFLSRLIGFYCVIFALVMSIRGEAMAAAITGTLHSQPLMVVMGIVTLAAGLAMVLAHNVWSGGVLRVAVTVVGWLSLLKGLSFLLMPADVEANFYLGTLRYVQLFYVYTAALLLIGIGFVYGGYKGAK